MFLSDFIADNILSIMRTLFQSGLLTWLTVFVFAFVFLVGSSLIFHFNKNEPSGTKTKLTGKVVGSLTMIPGIVLLILFALRAACYSTYIKTSIPMFGTWCTAMTTKLI